MHTPDPASTCDLLEHSGWLRGLARRLLRDEHRAEDAVQDTLAAALAAPPRGGPGRGWLATVLVNRVRQEERGRLRRAARERASERASSEPSAADTVARLELQRRVVDAVQRLDEPYRTALVLRFLDGLPPREVARRTRAPVKTVHTRLERGLAQLRVRLDAEYGRRDTWAVLMLPLAAPRILAGSGVAATTGVLLMSTQVKLGIAVAAAAVVGLVAWQMHRVGSIESQPRGAAPAVVVHDALERPAPPAREAGAAETRASVSAAEPAPAPSATTTAPAAAVTFEGRVVDEHSAPVAGLVVRFRPTSHPDEPLRVDEEPIVSGADGGFGMELPRERGLLTASGRGFASVVEPGLRGEPPPVPPVIVVAPAQTFAGVVVDADGRPLPGAELAIELSRERAFELTGAQFAPPLRRGLADAEGRFTFAEVGALSGLGLAARHAGYVGARSELPLTSAFDLRLVLEPLATLAATLTGRVVDGGGVAVEGAYVSLGEHTVRSDADGAFTLELPSSEQPALVRAVLPGFLPAQRELVRGPLSVRDPLSSGAAPGDEPFVLVLGLEALSITGRVLDAVGEPLAGVRVWTPDGTAFGFMVQRFGELDFYVDVEVEEVIGGGAGGGRQDRRETQSGADGAFALHGLAERDYAVFALHSVTHEVARAEAVSAGTSGLVLRLAGAERMAAVAGRVVSFSGAPLAGATLEPQRRLPRGDGGQVLCSAGAGARITTDADGRFRFESLAVEHTALLLGGEPVATPQTIDLAREADIETLVVRVPAKCHLRVVLSDPELADTLSLLDADGAELMMTVTAGSITLGAEATSLSHGRSDLIQTDESARTLVLHKQGSEVLRVPLELRPGEVHEIRP